MRPTERVVWAESVYTGNPPVLKGTRKLAGVIVRLDLDQALVRVYLGLGVNLGNVIGQVVKRELSILRKTA